MSKIQFVAQLEKRSGLSTLGVIVASTLVFVCTLLLTFNIQGGILSDTVGFYYPAYQSLKSIEQKKNEAQWLSYWFCELI